MRWVVYILAVLLIVTQAIAAPCTFSTTPIIDLLVENITVPQGERLQGTVSLGNNITAILDVSSVDNHPITLQDGKWNLTVNTQKNHIRYLFYAVADTSCTATKLLTINVLHPPLLKALNPQAGNVTLQEGHGITFRVNSSLPGVWTLDGVQVSTIKSYAYRSSYNDAGNYLVRFRAKDTNNLQSEIIWNLSITNVNRAPLLLSRIRGIAIPINGTASANLSNYFVDPDGTRLDYSYVLEYPSNLSSIAKGEAKIELRENIIELTGIIPGTFFLTFTATDLHGAQAKSDPVTFKVIDAKLQTVDGYCGDKVCTAPENCLTCTKDCGVCKECVPQWDCTEWNSCLAEGFEYRTCIVINR